jgi:hypothetical protein
VKKVGGFRETSAAPEWPFTRTAFYRSWRPQKILIRKQDTKEAYLATKKLKTAKELQKTKPLVSVRNLRKPVEPSAYRVPFDGAPSKQAGVPPGPAFLCFTPSAPRLLAVVSPIHAALWCV